MTSGGFEDRVRFLDQDRILEVDFSNLTFDVSGPVNAFYDMVDRRLSETAKKWFFLVNYQNCKIMPEAWITFAHRGKRTNIAYSLGSARYAASELTSKAIREHSKTETFDPSLFASRDAALEYLHGLRESLEPGALEAVAGPEALTSERSSEDRITFHADLEIMEVDLSNQTFARSSEVNAFYDKLDEKLSASGRKWYFLINYNNCVVLPEAWVAYASRGKRANLSHSLGTVRFDASPSTERAINDRAREERFDPNLVQSRDAAIARILQLKLA